MIESIRRPIASSGKPQPRARAGRWLLTGGVLVCGSCGSNYCGTVSSHQDYYVCGAYKYRRGVGCSSYWQIKREELESAVFQAIAESMPRESVKRIVKRINEQIQEEIKLYQDTETERVQRVIELEKEIKRLSDAIARGVASEVLEIEINKRIAEKKRFESLALHELPKLITVEQFAKVIDMIEQAKGSDDVDLKQRVIHQWVHRLEAFPERREIILTLRNNESENNPILLPTDGGASVPYTLGVKSFVIKGEKYGKLQVIAA
jgi:hypothetical protein